jgi:hypothetical protein
MARSRSYARNRRRRAARGGGALALSFAVAIGATGCSNLDDVVRTISRTQQVDEATVRAALRQGASSEAEQLSLARQWEADLPSQPLPNLSSALDDIATEVRAQVRSATCSALVDIARDQRVPSGDEFVTSYLGDIATGSLPYGELQQLIDTFDELWADAYAGTLTSFDVRLTLMEIQYC